MAKKRKSASKTSTDQDAPVFKSTAAASSNKQAESSNDEHGEDFHAHDDGDSDSDDSSSSSSEDSLVLEGELIRNPDADPSDDDSVSSEEEEEENGKNLEPAEKKAKQNKKKSADSRKSSKTKKTKTNKAETIQVEFLFCDMNEKFFHGIKTLLHRHGIHAPHSTQLADLIIENVSVGTVLSTDFDPNDEDGAKDSKPSSKSASLTPKDDPNVFGFASVINLTTHHSTACIQSLKALCLQHCPSQNKAELETVLSGKTKRPAGFFFHERMVNVPLEITEVLHQQLVLDMDWAVKNAEGGEDERKSLDFGAFVRLAPCYNSSGSVVYKYFDDEVFATNAEFVYTFEMPKMYEADEEEGMCSVIVMTKTGHREAMKDLGKMIGGK